MKNILILLSILMASGCASIGQGIPKSYQFNDSKGVVFLSVRHQPIKACEAPAPYMALIKDDSGVVRWLNVKNLFIKTDFSSPEGYFYAFELEAGNHYIAENRLSYNKSGVEKKISYKFVVKPNKATYLGELTFTAMHKDTFKRDCDVVHVTQKNMFKRDYKLLEERIMSVTPAIVEQNLARAIYIKEE
ncbi:MAG: hypothetical protein OEY89_16040 [Gammaproteobacteria bacterium]|nr:hypothetical protein [Gammaproteobacteria bacterium]